MESWVHVFAPNDKEVAPASSSCIFVVAMKHQTAMTEHNNNFNLELVCAGNMKPIRHVTTPPQPTDSRPN